MVSDMGLSKAQVEKFYDEHVGHCISVHGQPVLHPDCPVCIAFCERALKTAGKTPDDVIADARKNNLPEGFIAMAKAIKKNKAGAWD